MLALISKGGALGSRGGDRYQEPTIHSSPEVRLGSDLARSKTLSEHLQDIQEHLQDHF